MPDLHIGATDRVVVRLRGADGNFMEHTENITFNSSDASVIQVSQVDTNTAVVTAVGVGTANVTATVANPSGFVLNVEGRSYTVKDAPAVAGEGEPVSGEIVSEDEAHDDQGAGTAPSLVGNKEPLPGDQPVNEPGYGTVDKPVMGTGNVEPVMGSGYVEPVNPAPATENAPVNPQTGTGPTTPGSGGAY